MKLTINNILGQREKIYLRSSDVVEAPDAVKNICRTNINRKVFNVIHQIYGSVYIRLIERDQAYGSQIFV